MAQAPCKGCQERKLACHDTCEKFAAFRKELEAENEKRKKVVRSYEYASRSSRQPPMCSKFTSTPGRKARTEPTM